MSKAKAKYTTSAVKQTSPLRVDLKPAHPASGISSARSKQMNVSISPAKLADVTPISRTKAKKTAKQALLKDQDGALVRLTMAYARAAASVRATYKADPDPDCKHAELEAGAFEQEARTILRKIARVKAMTPEGIRAKARIVNAAVRGDSADSKMDGAGELFIEPETLLFILSLTSDVERFMGEALDEK